MFKDHTDVMNYNKLLIKIFDFKSEKFTHMVLGWVRVRLPF